MKIDNCRCLYSPVPCVGFTIAKEKRVDSEIKRTGCFSFPVMKKGESESDTEIQRDENDVPLQNADCMKMCCKKQQISYSKIDWKRIVWV